MQGVVEEALERAPDVAAAAGATVMMRIGEMAVVTGCSERALRYYEEIGLLRPASHSAGGLRRYGATEVARVRRIRELQDLMGFDLDEIRAILLNEDRLESLRAAYRADGEAAHRPEILAEAITILDGLRGKVDAKLGRLRVFRDELDERARVARALAVEIAGGAAAAPAPAAAAAAACDTPAAACDTPADARDTPAASGGGPAPRTSRARPHSRKRAMP